MAKAGDSFTETLSKAGALSYSISRFKVSVVVPAYNTAEYLPECLDSLVGQSIGLDSIQIVVVDDGSTDGSAEVIRAYAERYPKNFVCLRQENVGQGAARNLGLERCEGEYVGFMDSDDFADADMYKELCETARAADADMCVCGIACYRDGGAGREYVPSKWLPVVPTTQESLFVAPQTQPPIRVVRRSILVDNGIRFPETRGSEDNGFHFKLAPYCATVATVAKPMVNRRLRSGSAAVSISSLFCEQFFLVMDEILAYYAEHGLLVDYGELLEATLVRMLLCSRLGCVGLVEDRTAREILMDKTMAYIEAHFSDRKANRYLTGPLGAYLKHAGRRTIGVSQRYFAERYKKLLNIGR